MTLQRFSSVLCLLLNEILKVGILTLKQRNIILLLDVWGVDTDDFYYNLLLSEWSSSTVSSLKSLHFS